MPAAFELDELELWWLTETAWGAGWGAGGVLSELFEEFELDESELLLVELDESELLDEFELPEFDEFELPEFELPEFELPEFELPEFELPVDESELLDELELPELLEELFDEPLLELAEPLPESERRFTGPPAPTMAAQVHAPQPWPARVFSAIAICWPLLAWSARPAYCWPPKASQVDWLNCRPP